MPLGDLATFESLCGLYGLCGLGLHLMELYRGLGDDGDVATSGIGAVVDAGGDVI